MNNNNGIKKYASEDQLIYNNNLELTDEQKVQAKENIGIDAYDWHYLKYSDEYPGDLYVANVPNNNYGIRDMETAKTVEGFRTLIRYLDYLCNPQTNLNYELFARKINDVFQRLIEAGVLMDNNDNIELYLVIKNDPTHLDKYACRCYLCYISSSNTYTITTDKHPERYFSFTGDGTILENSLVDVVDETLSIQHRPADAKAVGDALALKADKADIEGAIQNIDLTNYYSKTEIDNMEFITDADIDEICAFELVDASEVSY